MCQRIYYTVTKNIVLYWYFDKLKGIFSCIKVRLSIIEAVGYMSHLLSREKLEEQLPRLFSGINSLYRKHPPAQFYTITQVSFCFELYRDIHVDVIF
jgi:hypothetical protein